jgi:hypothetical protein
MLCYLCACFQTFGGSHSLHLQGQAAQEHGVTGQPCDKVGVTGRTPIAVYANYVGYHGQATTKDFSSSTVGNDHERLLKSQSLQENRSNCAKTNALAKRMKELDWLQITSVCADREASPELLVVAASGELKAEDVHVSSFVFSPLQRRWRYCLHTNCRQMRCDAINMTPSAVILCCYRKLICTG